MNEVAKIAKVSSATVSRVLRQPHLVNEKTRKHVLKVIREIGYEPDMSASQFRQRHSKTVLVIVPDIASPFFSLVLRGIQNVAEQHGFKVILTDTRESVDKERQYLSFLPQKSADGVILLTARLPEDEIIHLTKKYPLVLACEYSDNLIIPSISIDNVSAGRTATEYLIQNGHTKIAHITGDLDIIIGKDRLKGYRQALSINEIPINPAYIQEGGHNFEDGYKQMIKLLSLENSPTAVFCFNDQCAMGAIRAVIDQGKRVPEDISIIGFDNIDYCEYMNPKLTTIDQPKYEIGQQAMTLLLKQIYKTEQEQSKIILDYQLVPRQSVQAIQVVHSM